MSKETELSRPVSEDVLLQSKDPNHGDRCWKKRILLLHRVNTESSSSTSPPVTRRQLYQNGYHHRPINSTARNTKLSGNLEVDVLSALCSTSYRYSEETDSRVGSMTNSSLVDLCTDSGVEVSTSHQNKADNDQPYHLPPGQVVLEENKIVSTQPAVAKSTMLEKRHTTVLPTYVDPRSVSVKLSESCPARSSSEWDADGYTTMMMSQQQQQHSSKIRRLRQDRSTHDCEPDEINGMRRRRDVLINNNLPSTSAAATALVDHRHQLAQIHSKMEMLPLNYDGGFIKLICDGDYNLLYGNVQQSQSSDAGTTKMEIASSNASSRSRVDNKQLSGLIWTAPDVLTSTIYPHHANHSPTTVSSRSLMISTNNRSSGDDKRQRRHHEGETALAAYDNHRQQVSPESNNSTTTSSAAVKTTSSANSRSCVEVAPMSRDTSSLTLDLTVEKSNVGGSQQQSDCEEVDELIISAFISPTLAAGYVDRAALQTEINRAGDNWDELKRELRDLARVYHGWMTSYPDYWSKLKVDDRVALLRRVQVMVQGHAEKRADDFLLIDRTCANDAIEVKRQRQIIANMRDSDGDTILHQIVLCGHVSLCRVVVMKMRESGVDLSIFNDRIQTPLHLAIACVNDKLALCIAKAQPSTIQDRQMMGNNAIHLAVLYAQYNDHNLQTLRTLVTLTSKDVLDSVNFDGFAPVHLAARHNKDRVILILTNAGADINRREARGGATALILASRDKKYNAVRTLLELGANHYHRSAYGEMAGQNSSIRGPQDSSPCDLNDDSDVEPSVVIKRTADLKKSSLELNGSSESRDNSPHYSGSQQQQMWNGNHHRFAMVRSPSPSTIRNNNNNTAYDLSTNSKNHLDWPNTASCSNVERAENSVQHGVPVIPSQALQLTKIQRSNRQQQIASSSSEAGNNAINLTRGNYHRHLSSSRTTSSPPSSPKHESSSIPNPDESKCSKDANVLRLLSSNKHAACSPSSNQRSNQTSPEAGFRSRKVTTTSSASSSPSSYENPVKKSYSINQSKDRRYVDLQSYSACLPPQHQDLLRRSGNLRSVVPSDGRKSKSSSTGSNSHSNNTPPSLHTTTTSESAITEEHHRRSSTVSRSSAKVTTSRESQSMTAVKRPSPSRPRNNVVAPSRMSSHIGTSHDRSECLCEVAERLQPAAASIRNGDMGTGISLFSTYKPNRYVSSNTLSIPEAIFSTRKAPKLSPSDHPSSLPGIMSFGDLPIQSSKEAHNFAVPINRTLTCRTDFPVPPYIEVCRSLPQDINHFNEETASPPSSNRTNHHQQLDSNERLIPTSHQSHPLSLVRNVVGFPSASDCELVARAAALVHNLGVSPSLAANLVHIPPIHSPNDLTVSKSADVSLSPTSLGRRDLDDKVDQKSEKDEQRHSNMPMNLVTRDMRMMERNNEQVGSDNEGVLNSNSSSGSGLSEVDPRTTALANSLPLTPVLNADGNLCYLPLHQNDISTAAMVQGAAAATSSTFTLRMEPNSSLVYPSYDQTLAKLQQGIHMQHLQLQHQRIRQIQQTQQQMIRRQQQLQQQPRTHQQQHSRHTSESSYTDDSPSVVVGFPPPPYTQATLARLQHASSAVALQLATRQQQNARQAHNSRPLSASGSVTASSNNSSKQHHNQQRQQQQQLMRQRPHLVVGGGGVVNGSSGGSSDGSNSSSNNRQTISNNVATSSKQPARKMQPVSELLARLRGVSKDEITRMNAVPNAGKRARRIHNIVHLPGQQSYTSASAHIPNQEQMRLLYGASGGGQVASNEQINLQSRINNEFHVSTFSSDVDRNNHHPPGSTSALLDSAIRRRRLDSLDYDTRVSAATNNDATNGGAPLAKISRQR